MKTKSCTLRTNGHFFPLSNMRDIRYILVEANMVLSGISVLLLSWYSVTYGCIQMKLNIEDKLLPNTEAGSSRFLSLDHSFFLLYRLPTIGHPLETFIPFSSESSNDDDQWPRHGLCPITIILLFSWKNPLKFGLGLQSLSFGCCSIADSIHDWW